MSNMESLQSQLDEKERQSKVYAQSVAAIDAEKRRQSAQGYAVIAGAVNYGKSSLGGGLFGAISHFAKLFVIAFAFLAPSLLIWKVLL